MPDDLQSGLHLSPDQLSAFAEHVLPEHERLTALAHLSVCADCRQVAFFAQPANSASVSNSVVAPTARKARRRSWFTIPQLLGAATAAFACALILALIVHLRHGQDQAVPVTTAQLERQPVTTSAPNFPSPNSEPAGSKQPTSAAPHLDLATPSAAPQPKTAPPLAAVGAMNGGIGMVSSKHEEQKQQDMGSVPKSAVPGGSTYATLAPQKSPAPAALPMQTAAAPPPIEGRSKQAAPMATRSVTVNAASASVANDALSTSIDAASIEDLPLNSRGATNLAKSAAAHVKLPSKKPVSSQIDAGNRTLALDTDGSLFISNDHGRHWIAVATQWSGKAVRISSATTSARLYLAQPSQSQTQGQSQITNGNAAPAGVPQQQSPIPTAGFELSTSTGAVWVSTDGLTWRPR